MYLTAVCSNTVTIMLLRIRVESGGGAALGTLAMVRRKR